MVNEYTVAATAQYVSLPFLLLHTACLLHFLAPKPLGQFIIAAILNHSHLSL
jgi:hypothetical protein